MNVCPPHMIWTCPRAAKTVLSHEEISLLLKANLPFFPIKFTGGMAAKANPRLHRSLRSKVNRVQRMKGNLSHLEALLAEIITARSRINTTSIV